MMKMSAGILVVVLWAFQSEPRQLAPEAWVSDGDADGDGLKDDFEIRNGLDPDKAESFADGVPDEDRLAPNGKTMWDLQSAESSPPVAGASSGGACGATGLEVLLLAVVSLVFRPKSGNRTGG